MKVVYSLSYFPKPRSHVQIWHQRFAPKHIGNVFSHIINKLRKLRRIIRNHIASKEFPKSLSQVHKVIIPYGVHIVFILT